MMVRALLILIAFCLINVFSGCEGCSQSGRQALLNRATEHPENESPQGQEDTGDSQGRTTNNPLPVEPNSNSNIVKMQLVDGVYEIPVYIDGILMFFIFDTGASTISISSLEATFLYKQGRLTDDDMIGTADFVDANGNVTQGTVINLKTVTIGNKTLHNVKASVVNNQKAPLLFGESALRQFGKITIDYQNEEIIFH